MVDVLLDVLNIFCDVYTYKAAYETPMKLWLAVLVWNGGNPLSSLLFIISIKYTLFHKYEELILKIIIVM